MSLVVYFFVFLITLNHHLLYDTVAVTLSGNRGPML